jgi:hypothetical protein
MKKLVLGSLLLAALASQTTGCVITSSDDAEFATINAEWSFRSVNPSGQLSPPNNCPTDFGTVELHSQLVDANLLPLGSEDLDLFDCVDMRHISAELEPGVYETFIRVASAGGSSVYAESLSEIVDVTISDKTFSTDIIDNGGYFKVAWDLREQGTNAPLDCADVAGIDGVEISSTIAGTQDGVTTIFDCEVGADFSAPVMAGTYVVTLEALDTAEQPIGQGALLNNKVMRDHNHVADLGTVTLLVP